MKTVTTTSRLLHSTTESKSHLFDDWFDPIETGIRDRVRGLIEEMIRGELDAALSRPRYGRLAEHAEGGGVAEVVTAGPAGPFWVCPGVPPSAWHMPRLTPTG
jgi:hypothetical protein